MNALSDCFVSVIAPTYNDAEILQEFIHVTINTLKQHYTNYELILVDDASVDASMEVFAEALKDYDCMRVLRLSRAFGEEIAISAGLEGAIGDFVVVLLPHCDPPELIPALVAGCQAGSDIVVGVQRSAVQGSLWVRAGKVLLSWYSRRFLNLELPANQAQFRVLSRRVANTLLQIKDHARYLRLMSLSLGYRYQLFEYEPVWRQDPQQKRGAWYAVNLMLDIITTTSRHPLRFVTWTGMLASVCNALYSVYILAVYCFQHKVARGWTTLSLQISVLFFFLFLILMVACEYIGQILAESSGRPLYYLLEEQNSSVMLADSQRRNLVSEA